MNQQQYGINVTKNKISKSRQIMDLFSEVRVIEGATNVIETSVLTEFANTHAVFYNNTKWFSWWQYQIQLLLELHAELFVYGTSVPDRLHSTVHQARYMYMQ